MKQRKIVVTGMGMITPVGHNTEESWRSLIEGRAGAAPISLFDTADLPVKFAAEVKDFDAASMMPRKLCRETSRFQQFAYIAAKEALDDSRLTPTPGRTGVMMGTAMAGIALIAQTQGRLSCSSSNEVSPRFTTMALGNIAASQIAIALGINGPSMTVSTACASGGDAIALAAERIMKDEADSMLAVGSESILCPVMIRSLSRANVLADREGDISGASRPFDSQRNGFIIGEGGGALVLESEEHALKRGARIYGELAGWYNNMDGYHVVAPMPGAKGGITCIEAALQRAGVSPDQVGYINAHGTGTVKGDYEDIESARGVFSENIPPMSSIKGATGHMMGAGGPVEAAICLLAIENGILPPTINLDDPDPLAEGFNLVPKKSQRRHIDIAISNVFGFGGQNSCLVLKRY